MTGTEVSNDVLSVRIDGERDLRNQWQNSHAEVHKLEHEAILNEKNAVNLRLDSMNELRTQINKERGSYVQRDAFEASTKSTDERLKKLEYASGDAHGYNTGRLLPWGAVTILVNIILYLVMRK